MVVGVVVVPGDPPLPQLAMAATRLLVLPRLVYLLPAEKVGPRAGVAQLSRKTRPPRRTLRIWMRSWGEPEEDEEEKESRASPVRDGRWAMWVQEEMRTRPRAERERESQPAAKKQKRSRALASGTASTRLEASGHAAQRRQPSNNRLMLGRSQLPPRDVGVFGKSVAAGMTIARGIGAPLTRSPGHHPTIRGHKDPAAGEAGRDR